MLWRIFKYLGHLLHLRYRYGHGIHSPYLFEFVRGIVFNGKKMVCPPGVVEEHRRLKRDRSLAGGEGQSVRSFVKRSSVSEKQAALLYRTVRWFHPEMVVELGTGLGVSTLYLARGAPGIPIHSIEGNTQRAAFAAQIVSRLQLGPVSIHWGEMEEKLEAILPLMPGRFLAFVDGHHLREPTLHYVKSLMERAGEEALIILDDIYWSRDMQRAWKEILSWPEARVGIDLYHLGVILLRKDLNQSFFKIKF